MRDSFKMVIEMVMAYNISLKEIFMRDSGKLIKKMVKENIHFKKLVRFQKEFF